MHVYIGETICHFSNRENISQGSFTFGVKKNPKIFCNYLVDFNETN